MGEFGVVHWVIVIAVVGAIWYGFAAARSGSEGRLFCTSCGSQGEGRTRTRGSFLIEIVLWLCLIVPGLIYSIWRMTTKARVCEACGASTLVPADSPMAMKMRRELGHEAPPKAG